jgi:hypothetical protein
MRKILLTFVFITIMWILFKLFVRNLTFVEFIKSPYSGELIPITTKISYYDIYLDKIKQLGSINIFNYEFSYLFLIEISIGLTIIAIIIVLILFFKKK